MVWSEKASSTPEAGVLCMSSVQTAFFTRVGLLRRGWSRGLGRLLITARRAHDRLVVGQEAFTYQTGVTLVTVETVAMPVALLERDELGAADTGDGLGATAALLGVEISVTLGAVGLLVLAGELETGQFLVAVGAGEARPMVRRHLVGHAALVDDILALCTTRGELLFVARDADHFVFFRDEALRPDGFRASHAAETMFMPLHAAILEFLHTCLEDISAVVASRSEQLIVARRTV